MTTFNDITQAVKGNNKKIQINIDVCEDFEQKCTIPKTRLEEVDESYITNLNNKAKVNSEKEISKESIKKVTNSDIIKYSMNEIINLPKKTESIIDLNNYYTYGVNKKNSLLYSLLITIDKKFKLSNEKEQDLLVSELINFLHENLSNFYKTNKYSKCGLKKIKMEQLLKQRLVDDTFILYLSDYLKINIVVIDIIKESYLMTKEFNNNLNTIILIRHREENNDVIYLPLLNIFGQLPNNDIYISITNTYIKEESNIKSISCDVDDNESDDNNSFCDDKLKTLASIKSYTLIELQELSKKHEIDIYTQGKTGKKRKTKGELYSALQVNYQQNN